MNKLIILFGLLVFLAVANASEVVFDGDDDDIPWWQKPVVPDLHKPHFNRTDFFDWMKEFGVKIKAKEIEKRFKIWKQHAKEIWDHNNSGSDWQAGLNEWSHLTEEEFKKINWGLQIDNSTNFEHNVEEIAAFKRAAAVDWQKKGMVSKVKNQQSCGGCWAFAAGGALEGGLAVAGYGKIDLSPQQIIDCSKAGSCAKGGDPAGAIKWGMTRCALESAYPSTNKDGQCKQGKAVISCKSMQNSHSNKDADLDTLLQGGPVSVCINAGGPGFMSYKSGVYDNSGCGTRINHAVLAVGYADNCAGGKSCYIVKNSWGTRWGNQGYFLMARGKNMCGIASRCSRPTGCSMPGGKPTANPTSGTQDTGSKDNTGGSGSRSRRSRKSNKSSTHEDTNITPTDVTPTDM